jgi:hypothetical protein
MSLQNTRLEVFPRVAHPKNYHPKACFITLNAYHINSSESLNQQKLSEVFVDPITHLAVVNNKQRPDLLWNNLTPTFVSEVSFRPGVTDNSGFSAESGLKTVGVSGRVLLAI